MVQCKDGPPAYGKLTASTGALTNPLRYTARELDVETGAYFYRARQYDQFVGRFVSEDPLQLRGGLNFYSYVDNNPVSRIDPSGLRWIPNVVINFDPVSYLANGDSGPRSPDQTLTIPSSEVNECYPGFDCYNAFPGMTPLGWDVDFICTAEGWRKIKVGAIIINGRVLGGMQPPPN